MKINAKYSIYEPDTKKTYDISIQEEIYIRLILSLNGKILKEGIIDLIKTNNKQCNNCKYFITCEKIENIILGKDTPKLTNNIINKINNMKKYKCKGEEK